MDALLTAVIGFLMGAAGYALGVWVTEWSHFSDVPKVED